MGTYPTVFQLPDELAAGVGHVITGFTFVERQLSHLVYDLIGIGPKHGRTVVRGGRIDDAFVIIADLMYLERIGSINFDVAALQSECKALEEFRDKLAHGIWVKHPGASLPVLQVLKGKNLDVPGMKAVKARLEPKPETVTRSTLEGFMGRNARAADKVEELRIELLGLLSKSGKKSKSGRSQD